MGCRMRCIYGLKTEINLCMVFILIEISASGDVDFPRNGGNTIPINFGQSLEALYSKPSNGGGGAKRRKANTILPVTARDADTAVQGSRRFHRASIAPILYSHFMSSSEKAIRSIWASALHSWKPPDILGHQL